MPAYAERWGVPGIAVPGIFLPGYSYPPFVTPLLPRADRIAIADYAASMVTGANLALSVVTSAVGAAYSLAPSDATRDTVVGADAGANIVSVTDSLTL